jgi:hypothetical protein
LLKTMWPRTLHHNIERRTKSAAIHGDCALVRTGRAQRALWSRLGHAPLAWAAKGHRLGPTSWASARCATVAMGSSVAR